MTKIVTVANIPSELEGAWLQHLRDFDAAHPGCHFQILAESPLTVAEITEMFQGISPGFGSIFEIKK